MIAVQDLCGEALCANDAACVVEYPETGQRQCLCQDHGRQEEALARRVGLTIVIEWFDRGGE